MAKEECKCPPEGLPAWMGTVADLMSLLMCFFILLLSLSEMDVLKFKQIAGSMEYTFGVQSTIKVKDIPKSTSVIAQELRPGRPDPTPIELTRQQTIEVTHPRR
jgi:chemotaxis protein MotB